MADEPEATGKKNGDPRPPNGSGAAELQPVAQSPLPAAIENILTKIPDKDARSTLQTMLSLAVSRTSFGMGPDAETMKIMAETEVHEETCRLDAFKSSLANRDKQAERDHDFRIRRLNHQTIMTVIVLVAGAALIGLGIFLKTKSDSDQIGGYLMLGGGALLFHALGLKPPSSSKE